MQPVHIMHLCDDSTDFFVLLTFHFEIDVLFLLSEPFLLGCTSAEGSRPLLISRAIESS